jgi:FMN phosphatase YigB (HAD superfamily)
VCGSDVKHGKPHPSVFKLARKRLKARMRRSIVCVGDTPYDTAPALTAGIAAVGVLTGHFAAGDLLARGSLATFRGPVHSWRASSPARKAVPHWRKHSSNADPGSVQYAGEGADVPIAYLNEHEYAEPPSAR